MDNLLRIQKTKQEKRERVNDDIVFLGKDIYLNKPQPSFLDKPNSFKHLPIYEKIKLDSYRSISKRKNKKKMNWINIITPTNIRKPFNVVKDKFKHKQFTSRVEKYVIPKNSTLTKDDVNLLIHWISRENTPRKERELCTPEWRNSINSTNFILPELKNKIKPNIKNNHRNNNRMISPRNERKKTNYFKFKKPKDANMNRWIKTLTQSKANLASQCKSLEVINRLISPSSPNPGANH